MGSCNVVQNEIGGKELLLKACQDRLADYAEGAKASLTVQGITIQAKSVGLVGNNISVVLVDPASASSPLTVNVLGNVISVNLETDASSDLVSDIDDVVAAINANAQAALLVLATGSGATLITAAASQNLSGGVNGGLLLDKAINAKKGDLVRFNTIGNLTNVVAGKFYAIIEVISTTSFKISNVLNGTELVITGNGTDLELDIFSTFGGLRSKSFSFNTEGVDITNGDSDEWRKYLDKAGLRSFSVSGSGVYTNEELFQKVFADARENLLTCLMFIEVKTGMIFNGCFKITSLEVSGDYNAESNYSISAESSDKIEVVKLE